MRYVTSVERIGIRKGEKKGAQKVFESLLAHRFSEIPTWVENLLAEASPDDVERWSLRLLDASTLEEVFTPA